MMVECSRERKSNMRTEPGGRRKYGAQTQVCVSELRHAKFAALATTHDPSYPVWLRPRHSYHLLPHSRTRPSTARMRCRTPPYREQSAASWLGQSDKEDSGTGEGKAVSKRSAAVPVPTEQRGSVLVSVYPVVVASDLNVPDGAGGVDGRSADHTGIGVVPIERSQRSAEFAAARRTTRQTSGSTRKRMSASEAKANSCANNARCCCCVSPVLVLQSATKTNRHNSSSTDRYQLSGIPQPTPSSPALFHSPLFSSLSSTDIVEQADEFDGVA